MRRVGLLEKRYLLEVANSQFRSSRSVSMLPRAEIAFANFVGAKHAVGMVNGTATLHAALEALGVGAGDEVIVPSLTMSATCFAVLHANATPIFADVDSDTWQISPASVRSLIGPRTKAIITVSLYGGSPDYDAIREVSCGIPIIEDNAESLGTTYRGQPIGNFGQFSSYSFQSSKHLSAGEGGMLCTNDSDLAIQARLVQTLGYSAVRNSSTRKIPKSIIQNPDYARHESLGWNYRMSELTAAVVLGQTQRSRRLLEIRKKAAERILEVISSVSWLSPQGSYEDSSSSFWAVGASLSRSDIEWSHFYTKFLEFGGKGFYAAWKLGYQEPAFQNGNLRGREAFLTRPIEEITRDGQNPTAESLQKRIVAFRTNEWSRTALSLQATSLKKTLAFFS